MFPCINSQIKTVLVGRPQDNLICDGPIEINVSPISIMTSNGNRLHYHSDKNELITLDGFCGKPQKVAPTRNVEIEKYSFGIFPNAGNYKECVNILYVDQTYNLVVDQNILLQIEEVLDYCYNHGSRLVYLLKKTKQLMVLNVGRLNFVNGIQREIDPIDHTEIIYDLNRVLCRDIHSHPKISLSGWYLTIAIDTDMWILKNGKVFESINRPETPPFDSPISKMITVITNHVVVRIVILLRDGQILIHKIGNLSPRTFVRLDLPPISQISLDALSNTNMSNIIYCLDRNKNISCVDFSESLNDPKIYRNICSDIIALPGHKMSLDRFYKTKSATRD